MDAQGKQVHTRGGWQVRGVRCAVRRELLRVQVRAVLRPAVPVKELSAAAQTGVQDPPGHAARVLRPQGQRGLKRAATAREWSQCWISARVS